MEDSRIAGEKFARLVEILDVLRSENGCPWDREQDEKAITNFFLEEVYEAVEALYSQDYSSLAEELGDDPTASSRFRKKTSEEFSQSKASLE